MEVNGKLFTPDAKMMKEQMKQDQNQNIQVFVRVRPMNGHERSKNSLVVLDCPGSREVVVKERNVNNVTKTFTFDRVFGPVSKQIDVYKTVVAPLIEQVLLGYNCTVFAYGQTGTGKTFTMEGEHSPEAKAESMTWETDPLTGIVPRALSQLFEDLRLQNAEFTVRVSLLELYNEELIDLLSPSDDTLKTLRLYEDSARKGSVIIQGLEEVTVHSKHEVYSIMERGSVRRKTAATQMNATSSRSHTVFTITVNIKETTLEGEELLKIGKLHLVDLAGSENIGRSGAVDKRAREAGSINQSLLTLGRVITALVERAPHIPYRESKLTRILQDSLGGRTKTSIIATVSPASYNVEETLSTLDYAHRAKNITNRPEINQKLTKKAMLKVYTEEIERLRRDLVATREKNGIYVDKENYDTMTAQLDCQNQDLSEKIAQVRSLQETVEQRDEELTFVKEQWEETKDDLITANRVILETRMKLDQTLAKLRQTELQRDQQEHLVERHVVTEKQLTSEAAQLLQTTEDSTSNLEKLYRKLDRKKNVEQTNLEAGRRFSDDLGNQFNSMCSSLETFRVDHAQFCGLQRMKLDSFLQDKETQFAVLSNQMTNFLKHMTSLFDNSKSLVEKEIISSETWTTSVGREAGIISVEAIKVIDVWKQKVGRAAIAKLEGQLKALLEQMTQLGSSFKYQITTQNSLVNDYVTARVQKLEENRKDVEKFLNDQILANDYAVACAGKTDNMASEYVKTFEATANTLMAELQKMVQNASSFKTIVENNSKAQVDGLTKSRSQLEEFTNELNRELDVNKMEANLLRNNSKAISDTAEVNLNKEMTRYHTTYKDSVQDVANLHEKIENHNKKQKNSWLKTQEFMATEINTRKEALAKFDEEHKEISKAIEIQSADKVQEIIENIDKELASDGNFVTDGMNELGEHCNTVSKWADNTRAGVLQQSGKLVEFWESTYVLDLPTGMTPLKKVYEFPRNLSATSPHERIISRFTQSRQPIRLDTNEMF